MKKYFGLAVAAIVVLGACSFYVSKSQGNADDGNIVINALNSRPFQMEVDGNIAQAGEKMGLLPNSTFKPIKDAGITQLRIHDSKSFDWDIIFPDINANPNSPQSYNFANGDRIMKALVESGFIPFFRLGASYGAINGHRDNALNPPDINKLVIVLNKIVDHYVNGWDNGFNYPIKYIEVWNEPDGDFWKGDQAKFNKMCGQILTSIKKNNPNIKVGACGIANFRKNAVFVNSLLSYLSDPNGDGNTNDRINMDFFSWHIYEQKQGAKLFTSFAKEVRSTLDKYGYNNAESIVTEFNASLPAAFNKTDEAAVDAAATLIAGEENGVKALYFYPLIGDWGMFNMTPNGSILQLTKTANCFYLYQELRRNTPQYINIDKRGIPEGMQIIAAKSPDRKVLQLLIAYKGQLNTRLNISIAGVSSSNPSVQSKSFQDGEIFANDGSIAVKPVDRGINLSYAVSPISVKLIKIQL